MSTELVTVRLTEAQHLLLIDALQWAQARCEELGQPEPGLIELERLVTQAVFEPVPGN